MMCFFFICAFIDDPDEEMKDVLSLSAEEARESAGTAQICKLYRCRN